MGIKPLRSINYGKIFSTNNFYSDNIHENSKIIMVSQLEASNPEKGSQTLYRSSQILSQEHLQRQDVQYTSTQQLDHLQQYVFLLKNHISNIDPTNLYLPHQLRMASKGICQQTYTTEIYYPLYEYKMLPEMQARETRNQTFAETQIWYLILSVLNGIRQFERIKCISTQFNIDHIRFNSSGQVKIQNILSSPKIMDRARNQRLYWSHKNIINFFVQETYRFAMVLLQLCTMIPLNSYLQDQKSQQKAIKSGFLVFNQNKNRNIEAQIKRALQIVQQRYSDLLYNLINIMLCHPKDRPLPSQIYQIFSAYKQDIYRFKPFSFNQNAVAAIRSSLNNSKYTKGAQIMYNPIENRRQQRNPTYNSMNIRNNMQPNVQTMYNSDNHLYTYNQSPKYMNKPRVNQVKMYQEQPSQYEKSRVLFRMTSNRRQNNDTTSRIDYLHNRYAQNRYNQQFNSFNSPSSNPYTNYNTRNNSVNPYNRQQYSNMNRNKTVAKISSFPQQNMNNSMDFGYMNADRQQSYLNRPPQQNRTNIPMQMQMYQRNTRQNQYMGERGQYMNQYQMRNQPRYYKPYQY